MKRRSPFRLRSQFWLTLLAAIALAAFGIAFQGRWFPLGLASEWDWERLEPDSPFRPAPWFAFTARMLPCP